MKSVGYFTVESGKIYVSDPCYDYCEPGDDLVCHIPDAAEGVWRAFVREEDQGCRVGELLCFSAERLYTRNTDGLERMAEGNWERVAKGIGVDSGQVLVCDHADYPRGDREREGGEFNKDKFYDECCHATMGGDLTERVMKRAQEHNVRVSDEHPGAAIVRGLGVCSSSGYGDGSYPVYVLRKDGVVVGVRVDFVGEDEDEERYEDDDLETEDEEETDGR